MKKPLISLLVFLSCNIPFLSYGTEILSREFDAANIERISIENGYGDIQLSSHQKNLITIEAKIVSGSRDTCDVIIEKNQGEISLKTRGKNVSFFSNSRCEVNVVIKSPRKMNLILKNGSGDIQVSDIEGSLSAKTGSGNLAATGSFNDTNIFAGSGDVTIIGVHGSSGVNVGSGNAALTYLTVPTSGELNVNIGSGNLNVFLPKNSSAQTQLRIGSGSQKNELDQGTPSKFLIKGNIGSGNLVLRNR